MQDSLHRLPLFLLILLSETLNAAAGCRSEESPLQRVPRVRRWLAE